MKILKILLIVVASSLVIGCSVQTGKTPKGECPYKKYQCDKSAKKDGAVCPHAKKCKKKDCKSCSKSCSKSDAKDCSKCKSCSKDKAATCADCKSCSKGESCSDCAECSGK